MSDFPTPLLPSNIARLVGDTITQEMNARKLSIDPTAFTLLISQALSGYETTLRFRPADAADIQRATTLMITELQKWPGVEPNQIITANVITDFFKDFCKRHPDFFPFCV
jgi:hypothetical protein